MKYEYDTLEMVRLKLLRALIRDLRISRIWEDDSWTIALIEGMKRCVSQS